MANRLLHKEHLKHDTNLAIYAAVLIVAYSAIFLGACSPMHCRLSVAIVGILCIVLSMAAGYFLSLKLGYYMNDAHQALPIMLLGIGVDDMFIICNALD